MVISGCQSVETLMVNGNIDFSTPAENAKDELLPHLTNGNLVILSEMGHSSDVVNTQPDAFRHRARTFFLEGIVDDSKFHYEPKKTDSNVRDYCFDFALQTIQELC